MGGSCSIACIDPLQGYHLLAAALFAPALLAALPLLALALGIAMALNSKHSA